VAFADNRWSQCWTTVQWSEADRSDSFPSLVDTSIIARAAQTRLRAEFRLSPTNKQKQGAHLDITEISRESAMRKLILFLTSGAALALAGLPCQAALMNSPIGLHSAAEELTTIETVQFYWQGRRYCWYDDGWRGQGWYWCGYHWRRGFGWGGPVGWHGWRRPAVHIHRPGVRPGRHRPGVNRPGGNRPGVNRPGGNRPGVNRPGGNRPGVNRPGGNRPGVNRPGGNRPRANRPGGNRSRGNRSGGNRGRRQ
jgi:hypothetical protein